VIAEIAADMKAHAHETMDANRQGSVMNGILNRRAS
jgi:hypothetical protein